MKKYSQKGIAHLGMLLLVLFVALASFTSYKVVKDRNDKMASNKSTVAKTSTTSAQVIPVIKNTADLNTVETTLDNQNIDGNLNPDNLNDDVNSLL